MKSKFTIFALGLLLYGSIFADGLPKPYTPGLGEYMLSNQIHHAKLWFAGVNKNWELADYELDEIQETLEDISKYQPNFDNKPIAKLIASYTTKPIEELKAAIDQKSSQKFAKAFDGLTKSCNACHQATEHAFIQIQRPTSLLFTNQKY